MTIGETKNEKKSSIKRQKRKKKVNHDEEEFVVEEEDEYSSEEEMNDFVEPEKPKRKYKKRKKKAPKKRKMPSRKKKATPTTVTDNKLIPKKRKRFVQRQSDFPKEFSGDLYCAVCNTEKIMEDIDSTCKCKTCAHHVWKWCENCKESRITGYRSLAGFNNHICEGKVKVNLNSPSKSNNSITINPKTGDEETFDNGKVIKRRKRGRKPKKQKVADASFVPEPEEESEDDENFEKDFLEIKRGKRKERKKRKPSKRNESRDSTLYEAAKILLGFRKAKLKKAFIINLPGEVITVLKA